MYLVLDSWFLIQFYMMQFREATIQDIPQIQIVRHTVTENRLPDPALVTDADCEMYITQRGKGWVCEMDGEIVGFAIADLVDENIWALFVLPDYETKGIGKKLQQLMLDWYFEQGKKSVWLGTAPNTRAEKFYLKSGWKNTGARSNGEIKFEMSAVAWQTIKNNENYALWSKDYDSMHNRTRDLEAAAFRKVLENISFSSALELGCGTGKNTEWLAAKAKSVIAVDMTDDMQKVAKEKIKSANVRFVLADINEPWNFIKEKIDLVSSSLVLEHTGELSFVFEQAAQHLQDNGYFYVGELHPYKQYHGGKARFETPNGLVTLECFTHHVSDYVQAAVKNGFVCMDLQEWFDDGDPSQMPRIITFLFQKA